MRARIFLAIDLKSFYASAECAARHLDPLNANLVVADASRSDKTICLAVSPALKKFGVPGRPRLFEVRQRIHEINRERAQHATYHHLSTHSSIYRGKLLKSPNLRVTFKIAKPRMEYYMQISAKIFEIYLRYIKPNNIHVYSIDEVFMDVTDYLHEHQISAHDLAKNIIQQIQAETHITATAGIGTNLYLAKVAMDIVAKRIPGDQDGVRIAQMNEAQYRHYLWAHTPLTDFWRLGKGYAKRLEKLGLHTMGDIARCSLGKLSDPLNEEVLYREFGKNAELLIDHAWGYESATIADIKSYTSDEHGIYSGQVLMHPYKPKETCIVVNGMADDLALTLVKRGMMTDSIEIVIQYDVQSLTYAENYSGAISEDFYGRQTPKPDHAKYKLRALTDSAPELRKIYEELFKQTVNQHLLVRKLTLIAHHLTPVSVAEQEARYEQTDLFSNVEQAVQEDQVAKEKRQQNHQLQKLIVKLQRDTGNKNIIIHGSDLLPGSTVRERNNQIGGHHI
ncbi:LytTR family transcriptional regulator [uncultured Limosilactobacillus sp.]|uniref:Y-family DNA polymerase n=1 Tax=uncultured Limosilactobacillus sp. TaxID=2837629 RepID=UPI0025DE7B2D|nr:LytTR family transcriptional regulator [uncultured Limosilactobacillus sp.]